MVLICYVAVRKLSRHIACNEFCILNSENAEGYNTKFYTMYAMYCGESVFQKQINSAPTFPSPVESNDSTALPRMLAQSPAIASGANVHRKKKVRSSAMQNVWVAVW